MNRWILIPQSKMVYIEDYVDEQVYFDTSIHLQLEV